MVEAISVIESEPTRGLMDMVIGAEGALILCLIAIYWIAKGGTLIIQWVGVRSDKWVGEALDQVRQITGHNAELIKQSHTERVLYLEQSSRSTEIYQNSLANLVTEFKTQNTEHSKKLDVIISRLDK